MRAARAATLTLIGCLLALTPRGMLAQDMDADGTLDAVDICKLDPASPSPCGFDTDKGDLVEVSEEAINLDPGDEYGGPTFTVALVSLVAALA